MERMPRNLPACAVSMFVWMALLCGMPTLLHGFVVVPTLAPFHHRQDPSPASMYHRVTTYPVSPSSSKTACGALTERQQQFWEDVQDGLRDIEAFYQKEQGVDREEDAATSPLERIWTFCQSAQGKLPPPEPAAPGHEPSEEHIVGLTAQPYWNVTANPQLFPWAAPLEAQAAVIADELQRNLQPVTNTNTSTTRNTNDRAFASDSVWQNQVMGAGWSAIRLQRLGVWNADTCAQFGQTYALLQELNIPLAVRGVCFARQAPGTGVQPHSDGRNFILTSHLGLAIPEGCWMEVAGQRQSWEEGRLLTLDTSFTHATGNPSTDQDRYVLIIDFWHPELTRAEIAALEFIYDLRNKFESGQIPFRPPRRTTAEPAGQGLQGLWQSLTGSGS